MSDNKLKSILGISLLLFIIALVAAGFAGRAHRKGTVEKEKSSVAQKKQYVCSMHPQVIRNSPGNCPICGMALIEKVEKADNDIDTSLADAVKQVNKIVLGTVNTVLPEAGRFQVIIDVPGIINYDPRKVQSVSARFGGLIERSYVRYQFQRIRKGQKIFEIYSPDIYTQRWNYVKLIQAFPDRDDLTKEALSWFSLLGLSSGQIDSLKNTVVPDYHLAVYSQSEGFAVSSDFNPDEFFSESRETEENPVSLIAGAGSIGLNEGNVVGTGQPLFKLIDINSLRIDLKVKTEDCPLIHEGQTVRITDAADSGKKLEGQVSQIDPLNGGLFQTVKVYLNDRERLLLPGRKIRAEIITDYHEGVWVPSSSVIDLGGSSSVFIKQGSMFIARKVSTGLRTAHKVEILSGINSDSEIAEKALLLADSDGLIYPDK